MKKAKNLKSTLWLAVAVILLMQCSDNPTGPPYVDRTRKIVFTSARNGVYDHFDLFMMFEDGSGLEQLTSGMSVRNPTVINGGAKIAYTSDKTIFTLDLATRETEEVFSIDSRIGVHKLSPDGSLLVYTIYGEDNNFLLTGLDQPDSTIIQIDYSGVSDFSWSPDGRSVLFSSNGSNSSLCILDIETKVSEKIMDDAWCGRWINDGRKISYIFSVNKIGIFDLEAGQTTTTDFQLVNDPLFDMSWSFDENTIVFTTMGGSEAVYEYTEIYSYYINESKTVRLTNI